MLVLIEAKNREANITSHNEAFCLNWKGKVYFCPAEQTDSSWLEILEKPSCLISFDT